MKPSAITLPIEALASTAAKAARAPHGEAEAVYQAAAREHGVSRATLLRQLKLAGLSKPRKARTDSGAVTLPYAEAESIVRWQMEHARKNGSKRMMTLEDSVNILRANGVIKAEALDKETGEIRPLSLTAIRRAISTYKLDSKVLRSRAPSIEVAAKYPNHVWQLDASLCTLYYLPKDGGLSVMRAEVFEKNKPENYKKVEQDRVWRYVLVDKCSHAIYVEYVFGGESAQNVAQVLINAMQRRAGEVPFGVPENLYVDPASANRSEAVKRLCEGLNIKLEWHMPSNSQATGSVEKAQDIVETHFESMLASRRITNLAELNEFARQWRIKFATSAKHSRHKMTRQAAWIKIPRAVLVQAPSADVCMALATSAPKEVTVTQNMTIKYKGQEYKLDTSKMLGLYVGQKLMACMSAFDSSSIQVWDAVTTGGAEPVKYSAALVQRGDWGYRDDAPVYGEGFAAQKKTQAQAVLEDFAAKRELENAPRLAREGKKAKPLAFGGTVDPFKHMAELPELPFVPVAYNAASERRIVQEVDADPMVSLVEACKEIKGRLGEHYDKATYTRLAAQYASGEMRRSSVDALIAAAQDALRPASEVEVRHTGTDDAKPFFKVVK